MANRRRMRDEVERTSELTRFITQFSARQRIPLSKFGVGSAARRGHRRNNNMSAVRRPKGSSFIAALPPATVDYSSVHSAACFS
jgi:hypothetical protein